MAEIGVELEEGTYTIVDGRYTKLIESQEGENNEETVEYLDLDMEVVEAVTDNTGYYTTVEECRGNQTAITSNQKTIVVQPTFLTENITSFSLQNGSNKSGTKKKRQRKKNNAEKTFIKIEDVEPANEEENVNKVTENSNVRKRKSSENGILDELEYEKEDEYFTTTLNGEENSLDLFFRSMAQTVLHLPPQVQAKIKMDICKVISMAEIKYCPSEDNSKSGN